ncbi:DUF4347 domain-containing protein, partial [Halomonas titanicae]|uniref:DUF4347 domain-containing protein n=1 Tax=Vreelandella titanicae TaxID=664683 RepID=UPI001F3F7DE8
MNTPTRQTPPSQSTGRNEVIFVDPRVDDYQTLLNGVADDTEVILLDPSANGVEQIAQALAQRGEFDAIHLVSHGSEGRLALGNSTLDSETLPGYASFLEQWGEALEPNGDILIYGCDVGAGKQGLRFVEALARVTGADVAASDDLTGANSLGGNWVLEQQYGQVETSSLIGIEQQSTWQGLLAAESVFDWDSSTAIDNGLSVSEQVDGVTLTISASNGADIGLYNAGGMYNLEGFAAYVETNYSTAGTTYTFTFDQVVDMGTIELLTTSGETQATFSASGHTDISSGPIANLNDASVVDLSSFTGITSFTMAPVDPEQFYFDDISFTSANNSPVFTTINDGNIDETAISGTVVLADSDIEANNGDGGGIDSVTYSIVGGTGEDYFDINASNGEVTLNAAGEAALDYETTASYTLTIQADDGESSNNTATQDITISVNDIAPAITASQSFSVNESDTNSTSLGTVATTGDDNSVSYSIESGNTGNTFTIDGTTGEIILSDTSQLDASATGSYTLSVQATDGNTASTQ